VDEYITFIYSQDVECAELIAKPFVRIHDMVQEHVTVSLLLLALLYPIEGRTQVESTGC
jgi:hypothetical protein